MLSSAVFRSFGRLKMLREKNLGKSTIYIGIAVMLRFYCMFFVFSSFTPTPLILLVKITLITFGIASQLKMTNSSGLMLVCRWASVNDLVQNKFRSIIHQLSHHLLDQTHWRKHQMNVQDLLKVNNKDTRTNSLTPFWYLCS